MLDETGFLEAIRSRHPGKWIGLKDQNVIAVSDSHDEIIRELKNRNIDGAYVFYSPTETDKQIGFLFLVHGWILCKESS